MQRSGAVLFARWTVLAIACGLIAGCRDYTITLPRGYVLWRLNADDLRIINEVQQIQVGPTIEQYRVIGKIVVGYVRHVDWPLQEYERSKEGYFIIDTAAHRAWQGLDERRWRDLLHDLGVREPPGLKRPSWWDGDRQWQ